MKFNGRAFAEEIEQQVKLDIAKSGKKPKIVSVLVGLDPASLMYTRLKQKAAERVGVGFDISRIMGEEVRIMGMNGIRQKIVQIGEREDVTGVMVQLPLPGVDKKETKEILKAIPLDKDVDGLRWEESRIVPATVKAIFLILDKIAELRGKNYELWEKKFVIVGARGAVGRPLVVALLARGVEVIEVGRDTPEPTRRVLAGEVVISCVGKAGVVTGEMVQDGVIAIDVGGDMTREVYEKASISVESPGGVGPVTVAMLMRSAYELVSK